ncbi:possible UBA/TS-N domain [Prochlorococcus marinus str. MIT 9313]|uniref:Lantipeptide prochlorosin 3.3 n=1 Tax=Prochlorococcus marinus (strain MIT 9313) TaxID=74547 RepID=LAN33_PROMM|nr:Nif11-like leader peptide family natural product precursor [Prochlorococcus marinus]Q7V7B7.1 RecName: Full=Lantipeptide prochlorosin 3.3; Short=Lantipeptide Pcn3.3; Flags: Precursor [Prochlorococcus marinus str. MIT 9313]CAE21007.1 possible UBA/TS-N domain [Prochlorococcus marinus str. MIT 9313]
MSEEQLKAFIAKVQGDSSLQEQLKAEGADVVAIAKAAGFTIKQQDLNAAASELSDEELEAASGGGDTGIQAVLHTAGCYGGTKMCRA